MSPPNKFSKILKTHKNLKEKQTNTNILGQTWSLVTRLKCSVQCYDKCVPEPCHMKWKKACIS